MKLIITEEQYRLIVENKGENLMDLSLYTDIDPSKWDSIFERLNEKKGGEYDGYYIEDNIDIRDSSIKEFKHLVSVKGNLIANGSKIESLGKLEKVTQNLKLSNTKNLKSLGNLKYVGFDLNLDNSEIENLGYLNQVGRSLDLRFTPKLKSLGKVSSEFSKEDFKIFVSDFLSIAGTGLSDEQIDKIKHNWLSKAMFGH
jgi:hypothetical protein